MSFDNISDNDDDLFSEIPSKTNSPQISSSEIQSLIDNITKEDDKVDSMLFRAKMALTLYDGSNSFIYGTDSFNRSIFNALNQLTDGRFQYELYADILEESISRRLIILDFVNTLLSQANEDLLNKISNAFNIEISQRFLNTYFLSFKKILKSSIEYNLFVYQKLCEQLGRSPIQQIISDDPTACLDTLSSDHYINNVFANIRKSYLDESS